ncbi:GalNAc-alpha-(1-_4)-GalNAc-alpha-(1-_3)-diNAcBac-PP-undecaprenol alpha-1,4-N-acetyl-D-galactosaminyltransferase [Bacillus sp. SORGH_AS 510]|uniref:glycosyltransferase n=1 Tax=Bacillus sp. SORGH_AS_0510 TaxID=3041771 RepID=UPI0027879C6F|nr:glycosyltransferase [Bacillus sp. SORGH_AS_0510]MDQ1143588.1 GalNAc-alpha-(1->4)-GalNAc-alpha-(1->3)-diNAcBac-PP-undecaprenol alpha-1,4-N-acetyl-D-galactosaminyltransferase [Bacillus sp. SORGH_AS_0510]
MNSPRITLLFPECENVHLTKDLGMIPFILHKYLGYDATIACYNNGEYPYAKEEVKGVKLDFFENMEGRLNDGSRYLQENASEIDILYLWGIYRETVTWLLIYKRLNPEGKVYLKLDANVWWMNRLELTEEVITILNQCHVISVECKRLHEYLNRRWPLSIHYIPNGYYNFHNSPEVDYDEKENTILTVGRIGTVQKANDVLLQAFKLAEANIPDWKLKVVGDIQEDFHAYINQYMEENPHLKSRIIFTGGITDRKALENEYRKAKIFCLTSVNEGFPLVFPEAAVNGCYIVSTDLDPAYDITDNQKFGALFPIGNSEQLSNIWVDVCNDEERLKNTCKQIQKFTRDSFNWIKIGKKLDLLFKLS